MKNSRTSSSRMIVSCFAIMFVPLWKFLAMNITHISGACSFIRQKWACSWFYSTREIDSPLAHAANMKESYESMKLLLGKIKYDEFKWTLRGYLKIVALLVGMQLGYIKYCCFLCEWGSRDKKNHYVNEPWPKRTSLTPGEKNVISPLVLPERIYMPSWHIKLGFMKTL